MTMFAVESRGETPEEAFEKAKINQSVAKKTSFVEIPNNMNKNDNPREYALGTILTGGTKVTPTGPAGCMLLKDNMKNKPSILSTVKNYTKTGTKQWKTIYAIYRKGDFGAPVAEKDSKTEAIDYARELAEENGQPYRIVIQKKLTSHETLEAIVEPKYKGEQKDYRNIYLFFGFDREQED